MTAADHREQVLAALQPYIARARNFSGWSLDQLAVRHLDPEPPWDYEAIARDAAATAERVLDLGTGGGEMFSRIVEGSDARCVATEEWVVNAPVARDRLAPMGIDVIHGDSLRLPLGGMTFDLVLDRHEALEPAEVARVLRPGGSVITEQVGSDDWPELRAFFPRQARFPDHFNEYWRGFSHAGLVIDDARSHEQRVAFAELGDIVYMLLVAPWEIPAFDPVADLDALIALEDALRTPDGIVLTEPRYIMRAHRPS